MYKARKKRNTNDLSARHWHKKATLSVHFSSTYTQFILITIGFLFERLIIVFDGTICFAFFVLGLIIFFFRIFILLWRIFSLIADLFFNYLIPFAFLRWLFQFLYTTEVRKNVKYKPQRSFTINCRKAYATVILLFIFNRGIGVLGIFFVRLGGFCCNFGFFFVCNFFVFFHFFGRFCFLSLLAFFFFDVTETKSKWRIFRRPFRRLGKLCK